MLFTRLYIVALQHKYMHTKTKTTNTKHRIIYCHVKDKYTQHSKHKKNWKQVLKLRLQSRNNRRKTHCCPKRMRISMENNYQMFPKPTTKNQIRFNLNTIYSEDFVVIESHMHVEFMVISQKLNSSGLRFVYHQKRVLKREIPLFCETVSGNFPGNPSKTSQRKLSMGNCDCCSKCELILWFI